jgi:magnesium transporter
MATQLPAPSAIGQLWDRWPHLSHSAPLKQFRDMHAGEKADFFLALSPHDQAFILFVLPAEQRHVWLRILPPDDAADLIQEVGPEWRDQLLALLDEPTRKEALALLAYKEDETGGLMDSSFTSLSRTSLCCGIRGCPRKYKRACLR